MSIIGRFELVSSDNFGEYLKIVGVGMIQRKLAEKAKITVDISESGGRYTLKTLTALKNTEINFVFGEEFEEEQADGRKTKSTVTKEGNKLIHIQRTAEGQATITREFFDTEMKAVFSAGDVIATRMYKRLYC